MLSVPETGWLLTLCMAGIILLFSVTDNISSSLFAQSNLIPHTPNFLWFTYKLLTLFLNLKHSATSTKKCYFHIFYADLMFLIEASMPLLTWEFPHLVCFSAAYLRISSFRLPCNYLIENFNIETDLQLLTWDFLHWGCLMTDYLTIYSLRLPCDSLPDNFVIEVAFGMVAYQ